ncbi:MAG TPA: His/Gly/Thr/Pro-type tRNA ligase C-terminal domain-containing protein, partial [Acidimicrobiales bacterium]|nr:His/Gly/Thr/Pro-type tRNA ligase C-terminal domain-containing protein [Acidimicrobiales bacterium]
SYALQILNDVYVDTMRNVLGVPVLVGRKPDDEKFAGADATYTCEGVMADGKALQMGTSHELGQNFAKAFDITYSDVDGGLQHCWTTSWGSTTRMVGGLIMTHGDDDGLVVPPALAPIQALVLVVKDEGGTGERAAALAGELGAAGVRTRLDDRVGQTFGRRVTDWELKGVPVRVEIGPRDLAADAATLVRRDTGTKEQVPLASLRERVESLITDIQRDMLADAVSRRAANIADASDLEEAAAASKSGFARLPWRLVRGEGEARLAADGVSVRCLQRPDGSLPRSENEDDLVAFVGRAY